MTFSYVDLARTFSHMIRECLTADELREVLARNASPDYSGDCCATHDFTDANQIMIDALSEHGESFDAENIAQGSAIDHAWSVSKAYAFDESRIPDDADESYMWANGSPIAPRELSVHHVDALIASAYNIHDGVIKKGEPLDPIAAELLPIAEKIRLCRLIAEKGGSSLFSRADALCAIAMLRNQ